MLNAHSKYLFFVVSTVCEDEYMHTGEHIAFLGLRARYISRHHSTIFRVVHFQLIPEPGAITVLAEVHPQLFFLSTFVARRRLVFSYFNP